MRYFSHTSLNKIFFIVTFTLFPLIASCNTEYTTQHFSFPPGSKPHNQDWEYSLIIAVSSTETPITKKSKKNVKIKVYNQHKTIFLEDNLTFTSASIQANVVWSEFKRISIELFEVGNKYAEDSYNKKLIENGPNKLINLIYEYNPKTKEYLRMEES